MQMSKINTNVNKIWLSYVNCTTDVYRQLPIGAQYGAAATGLLHSTVCRVSTCQGGDPWCMASGSTQPTKPIEVSSATRKDTSPNHSY